MVSAIITFGTYEINVEATGLVSFRPNIRTLTSPLDGIVMMAKKMEGEDVGKAETLYTITSKIQLENEDKYDKKIKLIREKILSLQEGKVAIATSVERVKAELQGKIILKRGELDHYQQLLATSQKKITLAEHRNSLFLEQGKKGFVSKLELHDAALQLLNAKEEMQRIRVLISQVDYQIKLLQLTCDHELETYRTQEAKYTQELTDAYQVLTDVSSHASADVTAPVLGKLGYTTVAEGDAVKKGDVIAVVVPAGARPYITLNIPSAAAGEVSSGQAVKIRVSSFPWRRYGKLNGSVKSVSPTAIKTPDGMVFQATVEAEYKPDFQLKHGMEVTANISTDKKNVYQWLFKFIAAK